MENIWALKLESLSCFEGQYDIEKVKSWVYQIENYSILSNVQNERLKARYTIPFLIICFAI